MQGRHLLSAIALLGMAAQPQACELSMALEQWPPYLYTQPDATPGGLDWELAQAILKEAGCKLQVQAELPTARRQRLFEQGQLNLMLSASNTPERRRYARFSVAYRHESVGVFSRTATRGQFQNISSVEAVLDHKLSLLAPKVGWYGADYARLQPTLAATGKLSTFLTFQQGLRMLEAGRADLILGDSGALRHEAKTQGIAISPLPLVVLRAPVHLMLNKASTTPADLERINSAITRLEHQGVLGAIRTRYGEP
ncbi:amino acid ABC transporter substrate-binding protein, PAAT family [Duganella sacchari]|uniref:Amino acid ABC transporter substrate-binding protein, PAAT family n=1 Tax=Duganella sacchari TaxID=551987 RepID=A0A1M7QW05_9BURK|nr:transporter substrate-binding domain-containing protein [Duganella sacchari]SHN36179.1 amino acid ABC transporter substrate-binding protein, PAAT family [Duganella sacchari]